MTPQEFCYWLQGWFELNATVDHRQGATPETMTVIKNHLAMVFKHSIDPLAGPPDKQDALNELHNQPGRPDGVLYRC